jgi:hypothetical protein
MTTTQKTQAMYEALDDTQKQVRLLRIQPATHHDDPIRCTLSTVQLGTDADAASQYEALSYVWGTE